MVSILAIAQIMLGYTYEQNTRVLFVTSHNLMQHACMHLAPWPDEYECAYLLILVKCLLQAIGKDLCREWATQQNYEIDHLPLPKISKAGVQRVHL